MVRESRVSLETLRFCRDLVEERLARRKANYRVSRDAGSAQALAYTVARLAELDAEIKAFSTPLPYGCDEDEEAWHEKTGPDQIAEKEAQDV